MNGKTIYLFPTAGEAAPFRELCPAAEVSIIGVGIAEAAASAAVVIAHHRPERVILCGIAGAIDDSIMVGEVVEVAKDSVVGLPAAYAKEYDSEPLTSLRRVRSFTVSSTSAAQCEEAVAAIEQMEGAGVAAVAERMEVEYHHIRAISNRIADPRSQWRIEEAVETLAQELAKIENK